MIYLTGGCAVSQFAYYVTLINVHPEIGYAGWYAPHVLMPYTPLDPPDYLPDNAATAYRQCNDVFFQSLRIRLVELSLLAARVKLK